MTHSPAAANPVLARVDGWPITVPDLGNAVAAIIERTRAVTGFCVFTLNLDHLVKLRSNPAFQDAYRRADIVTADGAPVAWLSRFQAAGVQRTTGADLFVPLSRAAASEGFSVYLFGSTTAVLTKTAAALKKETGGRIEIAGLSAPSASFDPAGREADAGIERIKLSGARLCFVALGAPKQEIFAARAMALGCPAGFVCVGAAVDFVAGSQVRAPLIFQRFGLEWGWRLATNPRRLAKRYADCARLLFDVAVIAPVRQQIAGREI